MDKAAAPGAPKRITRKFRDILFKEAAGNTFRSCDNRIYVGTTASAYSSHLVAYRSPSFSNFQKLTRGGGEEKTSPADKEKSRDRFLKEDVTKFTAMCSPIILEHRKKNTQ